MALFQKLIFLLVLTVPVAAETLVYFGTYTGGGSKGIYRSILDETTGELSDLVLAAELENPSSSSSAQTKIIFLPFPRTESSKAKRVVVSVHSRLGKTAG
jgi:hypothetical protein